MLELEAAVARILEAVPAPSAERLSLTEAHGRIIAEQVLAAVDLPTFDNSSMDGYALRAAEAASASEKSPVKFTLAGRVAAGEAGNVKVSAGTCVRVFTGSVLPEGADAVVMQEDTRTRPDSPDEILVLDAVKPWENVRLRGEDVKKGTAVAMPGQVTAAGRLALLAATGVNTVNVGKRPIVGLVATGSELRESGQLLNAGQIYESNRVALGSLCTRAGALPRILPLVKDELNITRSALEQAFEECDIVVTSGGVSVGEMDFIKEAFEASGGSLEFWKVAIKPGRPFVFGRRKGKLLFGLPGNPVSAVVTFLLLVRPALLRWQGAAEVGLPGRQGILTEAIVNHGNRRHFIRARVDREGDLSSAGVQASHMLSSLAEANALIDVAPATSIPAGQRVSALVFED